MTYVGRLKAVGGMLALAAVLTNAHVWGDPVKKTGLEIRPRPGRAVPDLGGDELISAKFADGSAFTYRKTSGETLFALQLKSKFSAMPERPRDYLLMIDTSASQVQGPLDSARKMAEAIVTAIQPTDRVSIWTANVPTSTRDLTRGFKAPGAQQVKDALAVLRDEVPLADTDLKDGLKRATEAFEGSPDRQQVLVFLGDGMSVHNPISASERMEMCREMAKKEILFFSVPLGSKLDPTNLHGFATGTGGMVIRLPAVAKIAESVKQLQDALKVPVFGGSVSTFETVA